MNNISYPSQFEDSKQYMFEVCHPSLPDSEELLEIFNSVTTYPKAVKACIAMIKEFELPWATLLYDGWSQTIYPNSLWLTNSGLLIPKQLSVFQEGKSEEQLLIDEPLLKKTFFGWGLYNSDNAMDGMSHKYITWHLKPILSKTFKIWDTFEYHIFAKSPEIPNWLNGVFFKTEKAIAVYSDLSYKSPDEYMEHEASLAIQIQSAFGQNVANEWVKLHRAFYYPNQSGI